MAYAHILTETRGAVGLIQFNRPDVRNALCAVLIVELREALDTFEEDEAIGAIVITGGHSVFAAGADINEMAVLSHPETLMQDAFAGDWLRISQCRKLVIAAVAGYALGGGCELAMMCDFILAADTAKFGQLEITVGIIPSTGGTQRLARFVGKSKAMEMCVTGRLMDAAEAERCGLVSRIVPAAELIDEAVRTAAKIAAFSRPTVMMAKECVNQAFETSMKEGLLFERRTSQSTFALDDQKEGMNAFLEKRPPAFKNR